MACERHLVYLGLGSNLGDRAENLRQGLRLLEQAGAEIIAVSQVYETAPWGGVEQPDFYNLAAACYTELPPRELLLLVKRIERQVGRRPGVRWGARILDIDILLYDDIIYDENFNIDENADEELTFLAEGLIIPHKEICRRAFVLTPLLEIAPQVRIPAAGGENSAADMLAALPAQDRQQVRLVGKLSRKEQLKWN